jgi:hypothetical protein
MPGLVFGIEKSIGGVSGIRDDEYQIALRVAT